ncbi:MAG: flagellar hook-basal body complex protein, partial [Alphaproteobacteria bacterium]|nr:flagellar hook-basal body complex protein [Alphaproteobacteria bacterium]
YLQGWPIDQDGNLPASQADISSLLPVDVAFLGGLTQPTTSSGLSMNLEQGETQSPYPIVSGFSADFARGIKVYDSLGAGHDLTINFKKMETPTAIATGIIDLSNVTGLISDTPPFLATDQFSVTVGAIGPTVITLDGTIADMLEDINAMVDGSLNPVVYAQINDNGFLSIKATNTGDNLTLTDVTNTPLAIASLGMGASPVIEAAPAAPTMLTPLASTPNTEGWWTIDFRTPTGAIVNAGAINFTGDGKLNAVEDLTNKIPIDLDNIDWGNGSNPQDIAFDISGFTQFSGEYNVISSTQNGAELGLRTGVSIDEDGFVIAQFSNGQSSRIFKLAIATFANANGLNELTGNVFRESDSSGSFNLREAGNGSAGKIASGALESSNVDLADEFSRMIVTQRAYSANTKVISTADQMTQELLQLR